GSRGIGLAVARRFVAEGARVCITARHVDALRDAAASFPPGCIVAIAGKADDPKHRRQVFDAIASIFGRLDVLVNNVAVNPLFGPLIDINEDAARKIAEVNVLGGLLWVRDAVRHVALGFGGRGLVVFVTSFAGIVPSPGLGYYGVSK